MPYFRNDEWNQVLRDIRNRHITQLQEEDAADRQQQETETGVVDEAISDVDPEYRPGGAKYTPPVEVAVSKNLINITGDANALYQQAPVALRSPGTPWPASAIDAAGQELMLISISKNVRDARTKKVYTDAATYVGNNTLVILWR